MWLFGEGSNRGSVETGETEDGEKRRHAETVKRWEGQTDWLGEDTKERAAKPCESGEVNNSGSTLNKA